LKITIQHRERLIEGLKRFYSRYPNEKWNIFHFIKLIRYRIKQDRDAVIGVSGTTGSGKSRYTIMASILMGWRFDLIENVSYIPKGTEISDRLSKMRKRCYIVDEAIRATRKTDWQSKAQKGVIEKIFTERWANNVLFLLMPNFDEFAKSIREGAMPFRIVIPYRNKEYARVFVYKKSDNWRSDDPWSDKEANDRYEKLRRRGRLDPEDIDKIERKLDSYLLDFIIPDLGLILPSVIDKYEELKKKSREQLDEVDEVSPKENKYKNQYEQLMAKVAKILKYNLLNLGQVNVTQKEICEELGVSSPVFRKYLTMELDEPKKSSTRVEPLSDNNNKLKEAISSLRNN